MSSKLFNKAERYSQTVEGIQVRYNVVSSSITKMFAALENKHPGVTREQILPKEPDSKQAIANSYKAPAFANQTGSNTKANLVTSNPNTKIHVANAAFVATHTLDNDQLERMGDARQTISEIYPEYFDPTNEGVNNAA